MDGLSLKTEYWRDGNSVTFKATVENNGVVLRESIHNVSTEDDEEDEIPTGKDRVFSQCDHYLEHLQDRCSGMGIYRRIIQTRREGDTVIKGSIAYFCTDCYSVVHEECEEPPGTKWSNIS